MSRLGAWVLVMFAMIVAMLSAIAEGMVMPEEKGTALFDFDLYHPVRFRAQEAKPSLYATLKAWIRDHVVAGMYFSAESDSALYSSGRRHASTVSG